MVNEHRFKRPTGKGAAKPFVSKLNPGSKPYKRGKKNVRSVVPKKAPNITDEILEDAEELLGHEVRKALESSDYAAKLKFFKDGLRSAHKLSRQEHLTQLAEAYGMYVIYERDPDIQDNLREIFTELGRSITGKQTALRLIVEQYISYAASLEPAELERQKNNYSRDVQAILTLIERRIPPSGVVKLAEKKGEGLEQWARWKSSESADKSSAPTSKADVADPKVSGQDRPSRETPTSPTVAQGPKAKVQEVRSTKDRNSTGISLLFQFEGVSGEPASFTFEFEEIDREMLEHHAKLLRITEAELKRKRQE